MFQKIYKIISVIKICHFMRSVLTDFIFVCLSLSIYCAVIIRNMFRLKSLLPTRQLNDKLVSQSCSQNCLLCLVRGTLYK